MHSCSYLISQIPWQHCSAKNQADTGQEFQLMFNQTSEWGKRHLCDFNHAMVVGASSETGKDQVTDFSNLQLSSLDESVPTIASNSCS